MQFSLTLLNVFFFLFYFLVQLEKARKKACLGMFGQYHAYRAIPVLSLNTDNGVELHNTAWVFLGCHEPSGASLTPTKS